MERQEITGVGPAGEGPTRVWPSPRKHRGLLKGFGQHEEARSSVSGELICSDVQGALEWGNPEFSKSDSSGMEK